MKLKKREKICFVPVIASPAAFIPAFFVDAWLAIIYCTCSLALVQVASLFAHYLLQYTTGTASCLPQCQV